MRITESSRGVPVPRFAKWLFSAVLLAGLATAQLTVGQTVTANLTVGTHPSAEAVNPVTNRIYVVNENSASVSVIDGAAGTVLAAVAVGASPIAVAVNPATNRIYVANNGGMSVSVIDGQSNAVLTTIDIGGSAYAVAVNSVTNQIYVANVSGSTVSVIDGATNGIVATINVGTNPWALAVNPLTNTVYVGSLNSTISAINGATYAVTNIPLAAQPFALAVNSVTNTIYASIGNNTIAVINGATNTITTSIGGASSTQGMAVNPVTNQLYVPNNFNGTVSVIDGATYALTNITVGSGPWGVALNPATNQICVANNNDGTVSVIDGFSRTVTVTLPAGANPRAVAANPLTGQFYVANSGGNTVTVVHSAPNSGVANVPVGTTPNSVAVNPVTNEIYVVNQASNSVSVVDGNTYAVIATISVGSNPYDVALNPATNRIYVANVASDSVTVIDGSTNTVMVTVPTGFTGARPNALVVNPATNQIYVADQNSNEVTVIDGATNSVATNIPLAYAYPTAFAVNTSTNEIYVTNFFNNNVSVISGATNTVIANVPTGTYPGSIALNPVTNQIYVANEGSNDVTVIDGFSKTVVATVAAGSGIWKIAVNPLTNRIYVPAQSSNNVTVIDGATNSVMATVPAGNSPYEAIVNPVNNQIYVGNGGGPVTVIDGASNTVLGNVTTSGSAYAGALNSLTGTVYFTDLGNNMVSAITPAVTQIPLTAAIAGVVDSLTVSQANVFQTLNPSPQFAVTVTSAYTSTGVYSGNLGANNPPPNAVYYQLDGVGAWQRASMSSSYGANPANFALQLSAIPMGLHTLYVYASYGREGTPDSGAMGIGNSPEIGNISAYVFLEVPDPTSTTLSSDSNPANAGGSVTFTATVSEVAPGTAVPTGTVTFLDGSTVLGTATLDVSGKASFATSSLAGGFHSIIATYGGDANDLASTSAVLTQQVLYATTTSVTTSPNPSSYGAAVTFTATVATGSSTPATGSVSFLDGPTSIGGGLLNASGVVTITFSALSTGTHSITSVYSGDGNNAASTSTALTQTVQQSSTSVTLTASTNSLVEGSPVTFTATVTTANGPATPTGSVTFKDGSTTLGTVSLNSAGVATFSTAALAVGSQTITAIYNGDTNDAGSTSAALTENIQQATTLTTLITSGSPSLSGSAVTFTATVTASNGPGTPSGTLTFKDGSSVIGSGTLNASGVAAFTTSSLVPGQHSISAVYSGDTNNAGSSSTLPQTVQQTTATALGASPNPALPGNAVTFTATVTTSVSGTPTGSVTFKDGITVLGSATLNGSAVATFTTSALTVASHSITAAYSGDPIDLASASSAVNEVVQENIAISLTSSANPSLPGTAITFTVTITGSGTGTPTGTVTFKDSANTLGSAALNSSGVASLSISNLTPGQHALTAVYSGDALNLPGTSGVFTQTVQENTSTTVVASANPAFSGNSVTFTATVNASGSGTPTGTVTFKDGSTTLGTAALNPSGVATYSTTSLTVASHSIAAVYGGDTINLASTSAPLSETVNAANFTLTPNPSSQTITDGQSATFTLMITPQGAFTSPVNLSCSGLPLMANCTFSPSTVTLGASAVNTTLTISTVAHAAILKPPLPGMPHNSPPYAILLFALVLASVVFLCDEMRRWKALGRTAVVAGILLVVIGSMTACAGSGRTSNSYTPTGTTQLQVTASSANSSGNVTHSTALTLTIQ
jgi:YVTN family beta-propeller protein